MIGSWGLWKPFPKPEIGGQIEAPVGPGVYEVRHTETGELIAFGPTDNVAQALATLVPKPVSGFRAALMSKKRAAFRNGDLEYRVCSATTAGEAKTVAEHLRGRREIYWRKRSAPGMI